MTTKTSRVRSKHWGPDDDYLVIEEVQVFAEDGFTDGDAVEVTIRKIERPSVPEATK